MKKETIYISLFGEFTMKIGKDIIDINEVLGKKLVSVFEVFVMNKGKEVSSHDLFDMFWEESDDPRNSLKYTIFRIRKAFEAVKQLEGIELIKTCDDGYTLNDEYEYLIDADSFDGLYGKIKHLTELDKDTYKTAVKIVDLYKGRLFANSHSPMLVTVESDRFSSEYVNLIVLMSQYLIHEDKYEEMMKLNHSAIMIEPFFEGLHYYYMKGLIEVKDYHRALKYYDEINEKFYNELGTGLSPQFRALYDAITDEEKDGEKRELKSIKSEMEAGTIEEGGFFCTIDMFKYVYELTLKNAKRENRNCYLLLLNIDGEMDVEQTVTISNRTKELIGESIRTNDVYSRVNKSQFIVLLICNEIDNVFTVAQRITTKFYKKYSHKKYRLNYSVEKAAEGIVA